MSSNDNVNFTNILFTREDSDTFRFEAEFDFGETGLQIVDNTVSGNQIYTINMDTSGDPELDSDISFPADLNLPDPDPTIQRAVQIDFFNVSTEDSYPHKGLIKMKKATCPPPEKSSSMVTSNAHTNALQDYNCQIKTLEVNKSGSSSTITITTENIDGGESGFRIVSNTSYEIVTDNGVYPARAFEIEDNRDTDSNNSFSFDFSTISSSKGLPILFYKKGTSIDDVTQSDAIVWF